ncbi:2TM domain-containing protein [Pseudofulvibacter geojedonensis]|uniref:2TM domain-containing protein n=1 Tax=Pseudofulvibacter geojedonensis TaxID=1123758 RepID=A0ABW3HZ46_9FLAO
MRNIDKENNYLSAKKRLDSIKSFYTHVIVYIVINTFLLLIFSTGTSVKANGMHYGNFYTAIGWGVIVIIHGVVVFSPIISIMNKWEEKKIKEFMQEGTNNKWE